MDPRAYDHALAVIQEASRERPADAVLRDHLRDLQRQDHVLSRLINRMVGSYFRWLGWLERQAPLAAQVRTALDLADGFVARPATFPEEKMIARAVPAWALEGIPTTHRSAWVRTLQEEPGLWIRTRLRDHDLVASAFAIPPGQAPFPEALPYRGSTDVFRTPMFHEGRLEIQDVASQAVSRLCAPQPGETWWDACAGEGGKTLHLAELMGNKGLIWASDRAPWRLARLKKRAARAGVFNYRSVEWDGGDRLPTRTRFDGVLVDAPCSGLGTWHRNPHARWTVQPGDVAELSGIQLGLLRRAAGAVKPGGVLCYSVCTLTPDETLGVCAAWEGTVPGFEPVPMLHPWLPGAAPSAKLFLWPQETRGGGMFIARWRRLG